MTGNLLTARQVAERLGVSSETVLRWTRQGRLPGYRIGGRALRFCEHEIDAWLEAHATTPKNELKEPTSRRGLSEIDMVCYSLERRAPARQSPPGADHDGEETPHGRKERS
jgi:excisionase family DNA binding protein